MAKIATFDGENSFLSNFWMSPVVMDGKQYPSVEHAFQAAKTLDEAMREKIRTASTPGSAKRLGRKLKLQEDWETAKLGVMLQLLRCKFSDPVLADSLIKTGDAELIEGNWWGDRFWGVCHGEGENHLGKLLMLVRKEISKEV